MPEDKEKKQSKPQMWKLSNGNWTKSYTTARADRQANPTRGDYDKRTKQASKGKSTPLISKDVPAKKPKPISKGIGNNAPRNLENRREAINKYADKTKDKKNTATPKGKFRRTLESTSYKPN